MRRLLLTLPTAAENLALDEALLEEAEQSDEAGECLRLWEPGRPMVVIGRSSQVAREVEIAACRAAGVPIFRRSSGGAAIVTGPGCLMYAVVLSYAQRPELRAIEEAHRFVLERVARALRTLAPGVSRQGISDLAVAERKFSGNSIRCRRDWFLYHGTLLYDFPLHKIAQCLRMPPRQPEYRAGRPHQSFLTNLRLPPEQLREALAEAFGADAVERSWPAARVARLVAEKYSQDSWNYRR